MKSTLTVLACLILCVQLAAGSVQLMAKLAEKKFRTINNGTITLTLNKNGEEKVLSFGGQKLYSGAVVLYYYEELDYPVEGIESCKLSYEVHDGESHLFGKPWIYLDTITVFNLEKLFPIKKWHYDQNEPIKPGETITLIPSK